MQDTGNYLKAYPSERFADYEAWSPKITSNQPDYLFLHDNFVVTTGIFAGENVVFDKVTEDWIAFCKDVLQFSPSDMG